MQLTVNWSFLRSRVLWIAVAMLLLISIFYWDYTSRITSRPRIFRETIVAQLVEADLRLESARESLLLNDRDASLVYLTATKERLDSSYLMVKALQFDDAEQLRLLFHAYLTIVGSYIDSVSQSPELPTTLTIDMLQSVEQDVEGLKDFMWETISSQEGAPIEQVRALCTAWSTSEIRQQFLQEALQQDNNTGPYTQDDCMDIK